MVSTRNSHRNGKDLEANYVACKKKRCDRHAQARKFSTFAKILYRNIGRTIGSSSNIPYTETACFIRIVKHRLKTRQRRGFQTNFEVLRYADETRLQVHDISNESVCKERIQAEVGSTCGGVVLKIQTVIQCATDCFC